MVITERMRSVVRSVNGTASFIKYHTFLLQRPTSGLFLKFISTPILFSKMRFMTHSFTDATPRKRCITTTLFSIRPCVQPMSTEQLSIINIIECLPAFVLVQSCEGSTKHELAVFDTFLSVVTCVWLHYHPCVAVTRHFDCIISLVHEFLVDRPGYNSNNIRKKPKEVTMHMILLALLVCVFPSCLGIEICPTREITASSGRITSNGYPNDYAADTDCTLTIKQPLDTKITFTFNKMDIESDDDSGSACYDSLTITGLKEKEFCGTQLPQPYTPKLHIIKLKMKTDDSVEQSGFDLNFTTVQTPGLPTPISVCPTRTVDASVSGGRVMSPAFPTNYADNLNCKLTLKIPPNYKTKITFDLFDVEYSGSCANDKLTISDSKRRSKNVCGTGSPSAAEFFGDEVYVHFVTNANNNEKGFLISYKLIPLTTIPTSSATTSPSPDCACVNGNSYIKRTLPQNNMINRANDDFSLEFKTSKANGSILYAKGQVRDYILLKLQNGNIVFEVDLGTGAASLRGLTGNLNDNAWHKVVVERRSKSVTVTVDDFSKTVGGTPGSFTRLDIQGPNAALYCLGGPFDRIPFDHNFNGCVRKLVVDGMKPIEAVKNNEQGYTLYGQSTLDQC